MTCRHTLRAEDEVPCPGCLDCTQASLLAASIMSPRLCHGCGVVPRMVTCPWCAGQGDRKCEGCPDCDGSNDWLPDGARCGGREVFKCLRPGCNGTGKVPAAEPVIELIDEPDGWWWRVRGDRDFTFGSPDTHDAALAAAREEAE